MLLPSKLQIFENIKLKYKNLKYKTYLKLYKLHLEEELIIC